MGKKRRTTPEADLWAAHAADGGTDSRNALICFYRPYVRGIARKIDENTPGCVDIDDLEQAGTFGLLDAIGSFDPARGVAFKSFSYRRIYGSMMDELRKHDQLTRYMRRLNKTWMETRAKLRQELGRNPSTAEIAERAGVEPRMVPVAHTETDVVGAADQDCEKEWPSFRLDGIAEQSYMRRTNRHAEFLDATRGLPFLTRMALFLHLVSGFNERETADVLNYTESWVSLTLTRAKQQIMAAQN